LKDGGLKDGGLSDGGPSGAGLAARRAALDLTGAVLDRHRPLDDALASALMANGALAPLEPRDRAFARLLVATVLRRLGQIDAAIVQCLDRPLGGQQSDVLRVLRLGAAQLMFLGTPVHAAVNSSVELMRYDPRRKGLVNAVLRRLARDAEDMVAAQDPAHLNTRDWLWRSWVEAYGPGAARAIAEAHLSEAALDLTLRDAAAAGLWAERLGATILPNGSLRRAAGGPIDSLPGYNQGAWWVQDAAAAMPVGLFGALAGKTVADLGAAPGGKTAQLAALGGRVVAVEHSARRARRLKENLDRLRLAAEIVVADAGTFRPAEPLDHVLLDAPCSATGTIRRHPDVAHLKSPSDVAQLVLAQDRLLAHAWTLLKPGGYLVYCTCSLQPEEGEARIAKLIGDGAPLVRSPIAPAEIGAPEAAISAIGDLRTLPSQWPELGGLDGFFAARLRRV
jgi:16S rRNA (cytosine967-C5)-methyltransferase